LEKMHSKEAFEDSSFLTGRSVSSNQQFFTTFVTACDVISQDKAFITRLKKAEFDVAFTHYYDLCPIGLIYHAKIPSWIWLNGAQMLDIIANLIGVPSPPSYVPGLFGDVSDKMTFSERVANFIGKTTTVAMSKRYSIDPETEILRRNLDANMPHLSELATECALVMITSDELYSLARPTLHKIVSIGGLGMKSRSVKPLNKEFKQIVDRAKRIVVVSFGSVISADLMPESWKNALIEVFKHFPEIDFIMRYSAEDLNDKIPKNAHLSKWIPQVDLLQNNKTLLFISHGGYNSVQEAIHSAVPIVTIPLFGDQFVNARSVERLRLGVRLSKSDVRSETLVKAIDQILSNDEYTNNVKRTQAMILAKPTKPEEQLVKWTEFVAEFKTLPNLIPFGTRLSFIQYHCLDVIALLSGVVFAFLFIVLCTMRVLYRKLCTSSAKTVKSHKKHN
uniref:UDP-glucuronosyltransferase n=1 Tax=Anisakis simplex TaxID=6269 RepID=A0A0M3JZG3_ANISI